MQGKYQFPSKNHAACTQHACTMQHPARTTSHPACTTQNPAYTRQYPACTQHVPIPRSMLAAPSMHPTRSTMHHAPHTTQQHPKHGQEVSSSPSLPLLFLCAGRQHPTAQHPGLEGRLRALGLGCPAERFSRTVYFHPLGQLSLKRERERGGRMSLSPVWEQAPPSSGPTATPHKALGWSRPEVWD